MKHTKLLGLISMLLAVAALDIFAGVATPSTIIVMPARRRMIELAGQIAKIKDVGLVAYNNRSMSAEPLIHIWNGTEWLPIDVAGYKAGNFMSGEPKHLILLGDSSTLPEALSANPTWCANVQRLTTLGTSPLLNELDKTLKFTTRQWKWLAQLNGLVLTDKNVERRRYGRWGAPGNETEPAKPKPGTDIVMPPAPLQSEPQAVTTPLTENEPSVEAPAPATSLMAEPVKTTSAKSESKVVMPPAEPVVEPPKAPAPADK